MCCINNKRQVYIITRLNYIFTNVIQSRVKFPKVSPLKDITHDENTIIFDSNTRKFT